MTSIQQSNEHPNTPRVVAIACLIQFVRGFILFTANATLYFGSPFSTGIDPVNLFLPTGMIFGTFDMVFSFVLWVRGVGGWTYGVISSCFFSFIYLTSLPSFFSYLLSDTITMVFYSSLLILILSLAELLILVAPWNRKFFKAQMRKVAL
ncbi:MAG: hypothetical protein ACFFEA_14595 [Candidatus Thorarchaeota archaeon]